MRESFRRLLVAWFALVVLTAIVGLLSNFAPRLQQVAIVGVALATLFKTRIVLAQYLGLRVAPAALSALTTAIALILVLVASAIALAPLVMRVYS